MRVILFRHGPAGDPDPSQWPNDADRPLTPKGIERTRQAARGLARIVGDVTIVLTSPYLRAHQTARLIGEAFGVERIETLDALSSGSPARGVLEALARREATETLVLVGHEPDLGLLAGMMTGAGRSLPLKKSGGCAIEFDGSLRVAKTARLLWYLPPRILRKLGSKQGSPV